MLLFPARLSPAFATKLVGKARFATYREIGRRCKWFIIKTMLAPFVVLKLLGGRLSNPCDSMALGSCGAPWKGLS